MNEETKKTKRILLTSAKGGVGVGFVAVNLAFALCRRGARVLLVDAGPLCRSHDAILGCAEDVIYDISDLAASRVEAEKVLLRPFGEDEPWLLPGVFSHTCPVPWDRLPGMASELGAQLGFDFVLIDTPARQKVLAHADEYEQICVITDPTPASLRAAEATAAALREVGTTDACLVINRFSLLPPRESKQAKAIAMVDAVRLPLLAILPTVGELDEAAHRCVGEYPLLRGREFRREAARFAFDNMAARLLGMDVPLLSDIRAVRSYRRKLLY